MRRNTGPKAHTRRAQSAGHSILFRTSQVLCALRFSLCAFLITIACVGPLHGESVVIPGSIDRICSYTDVFYHFPSENFVYYLNDRLLFMERPDGKIEESGCRNKLLKIVRWHRVLKKSLERVKSYKNNMVIINTANQEEFEKAKIILNLLGLHIEKTLEGQFRVSQNPASGLSDYYRFSQLNTGTITRQLNRAKHFYFKLEESEIPVPWDYGFLQEVTGLKIDSTSFFETMLKNEPFSLLLGVLYRLSDKEIDYISSLKKTSRFEAWKQIYNDKKFLMGMFVLSEGLRVTETAADGDDDKVQWVLPGGTGAESFWCQLAGENHQPLPLSSLEFLYNLATKDEGKLNYLYLFSMFLEPEIQKALFVGENAQKMQRIYHLVSLSEREKLKETEFPAIKDADFYTLLYSIRINPQDNQLDFPPGKERWWRLIAPSELPEETPEVAAETPEEEVLSGEKLKSPLYESGPLSKSKYKKGGLYLKLYGGANVLNGGDFSHMIRNNERNNENLLSTKKLPFYTDFGGELGYDFGRMGVAVEVGHISKNFYAIRDDNEFYGGWDHTFSAVPVLLNLYLKITQSSSINAYLTGGGGIYFGKYNEKWTWEYKTYENGIQIGAEKSTGKNLGFHLGATLEFNISKKILLFAQSRLRFVSFKHMVGNGQIYIDYLRYMTYYGGDLYYVSDTDGMSSGFYFVSNINLNDAGRKAVLKMNGLALTFGIKFHFQ